MDSIPFEKISVDEAKEALKVQETKVPAPPEKNWSPQRHTQSSGEVNVTKDVMAWLSKLPPEVRPRALAVQFPRIFNKIAALWAFPLQCEDLLNELLLDERGTRKGFPPDVAQELTMLKIHFIKTSSTQHFGVWGERIGGD